VGSLRVSATLVARGPAAAFVLDDEQVATVGVGAKRFPVVATIDGRPFRLSVARMGGESSARRRASAASRRRSR
jgi:hypothetical protein